MPAKQSNATRSGWRKNPKSPHTGRSAESSLFNLNQQTKMKTETETIIDKLNARIIDEISAIDADKSYDEMLDECYSFKSVGGPFEYMSASTVLREVDPTAYRCGFSDYVDSQGWIEFDDGYREHDDCERVRDEMIAELESGIIYEAEEESPDEKLIESLRADVESLKNHQF